MSNEQILDVSSASLLWALAHKVPSAMADCLGKVEQGPASVGNLKFHLRSRWKEIVGKVARVATEHASATSTKDCDQLHEDVFDEQKS